MVVRVRGIASPREVQKLHVGGCPTYRIEKTIFWYSKYLLVVVKNGQLPFFGASRWGEKWDKELRKP